MEEGVGYVYKIRIISDMIEIFIWTVVVFYQQNEYPAWGPRGGTHVVVVTWWSENPSIEVDLWSVTGQKQYEQQSKRISVCLLTN